MSVLKKIGIVLGVIGGDINKVLQFPFLQSLLGMIPGPFGGIAKAAELGLSKLAEFLSVAEITIPSLAGAKTGSDKLQLVKPLAKPAIMLWAQTNFPGHSKLIVTADVFDARVEKFISDFADIMNCFGE